MTPIAGEVKPKTAKKSSSQKPTAAVTPTVKVDQADNLLLVFMPPHKCVGIKLDFEKPESFESAAKRLEWEENASKYAIELKRKLELGEVRVQDVKERLIFNPPRSKIPAEVASRFTNEMIKQEDALFIERDFVVLTQELRESLGLKRADVERCLEILNQLKDCEFNRMMLLRNPDCVNIMRRMRRYIGNLKAWKLNEH